MSLTYTVHLRPAFGRDQGFHLNRWHVIYVILGLSTDYDNQTMVIH